MRFDGKVWREIKSTPREARRHSLRAPSPHSAAREHADASTAARPLSPATTFFLAAGCGIIAAGSYFAQPLAAVIGHDVNLSAALIGLIVTVSQLGYVLGLLFVAPLGDLIENRRLLICTLVASVASLAGAAIATDGALFLFACFGIGMSSIAVQMLVTLAAFMSDPARRGQIVGTVTSGLLVGILLAWPVASFAAEHTGWRGLFLADAAIVALLAVALLFVLPPRVPVSEPHYGGLIGSLWELLWSIPELRRRAGRQACLFAGFSLFWTAAAQELHRRYDLGPDGIALFGLVGGAGALIAPVAGRLADQGRGGVASLLGAIAVTGAFILAAMADCVWMLCGAAILVNAGVQANHVISQRAILSIQPSTANRLNSLYIAIFFLGGAIGSAISGLLFALNWEVLSLVGAALGAIALLSALRLKAA